MANPTIFLSLLESQASKLQVPDRFTVLPTIESTLMVLFGASANAGVTEPNGELSSNRALTAISIAVNQTCGRPNSSWPLSSLTSLRRKFIVQALLLSLTGAGPGCYGSQNRTTPAIY
jgi:hypothetical protein